METLKEEENWRCEKHVVGGRSRDLFGIWYPVEVHVVYRGGEDRGLDILDRCCITLQIC